MDRRVFLKQTTAAAGTLALSPLFGAGENKRPSRLVENVHVIFKTHLDIGFTDLSENVIRTYFESFIPAALSLSFSPVITNENGYLLDKMNHPVSPLDVVADGNRSLHGVIQGAKYADRSGGFELDSSDAFLVAPGRKSLLNFDNSQPKLKDGLHFCLCNNVWGTNFMMWFEDDIRFRFKLRFR